ncbi:MAG: hypothetical protein ACYDHY_05415 [Acidiferrobacterales bacterium]
MSIPLFIPPPTYVARLPRRHPMTLEAVCAAAGIRCKAAGPWTQRPVSIVHGKRLKVVAEPGDWGAVQISMKPDTRVREARLALAVLAFSLHDLVARQSIAGQPWTAVSAPRGRPASGTALSNAARQRRYRERSRG